MSQSKLCPICGEPITWTDHPGVKLCEKRACRLEYYRRYRWGWYRKAKPKQGKPGREVPKLKLDWKNGGGK